MSDALIAQLIDAGKRLDARGWVPGGGGNFSARLETGRYLLTASGRHKGQLRQQDFLVVDSQGCAEVPQRQPSAETLLHVERLNNLSDVNCVLHGHSPSATVLSRLLMNDNIELTGYEMLKGLGGVASHDEVVRIPVFENDQNIERLADIVSQRHQREPMHHGYLIRGHGVYAWGPDVDAAVCQLESLEFLLECVLLERNFG